MAPHGALIALILSLFGGFPISKKILTGFSISPFGPSTMLPVALYRAVAPALNEWSEYADGFNPCWNTAIRNNDATLSGLVGFPDIQNSGALSLHRWNFAGRKCLNFVSPRAGRK